VNYIRIYDEFIKDRRRKEPGLTGYTERHHIVPKWCGGTDDSDNIIRLTPEDHYFAHLLLAYARGGKNWSAVHAMAALANRHNRKERSRLQARLSFGHVRRNLARHYRDILSGPTGKISDKRKFELRNHDGRVAVGNRFELAEMTGLQRQTISSLVLGSKKNRKGWYSPTHNPDGVNTSELIARVHRCRKTQTLFHHDGRQWSGTRSDFKRTFGCDLNFQHDEGCVQGWYRTKSQAMAHDPSRFKARAIALARRGSIAGADNPNADPKPYRFCVVETGEIIVATKTEIRDRFKIKSANLCAIFSGKQRQTGGIALA
jgi:hypothetical protein